jgi:hypothetical protein
MPQELCSSCNSAPPEEAQFCPYCGTVLIDQLSSVIKAFQGDVSVTILKTPALALPILPDEKTKLHKVQGSRVEPYKIDLNDFSCACPDWLEQRIRFAFPDIRRACKHIVNLLPNFQFVTQGHKLAGWLAPIPPCRHRLGAFEVEGYAVLFKRSEDRSWIDVVTASRVGEGDFCYDLFGLNPDERRWASGERPKNSNVVKKLIRDWIKCDPQPWQG